jgi:hypothetical protein
MKRGRNRHTAAVTVIATVVLVLCTGLTKLHARRVKRSVAVLEYRSGVSRSLDITARLVKLLRRKTSLTVIDLAEARRRMGSQVDAAVANCAGNAACMARLGRRLRVNEVLLVGLSQVGDIIVHVSRILTSTRRVAGRAGLTVSPKQRVDSQRLMDLLTRLLPRPAFRRYGAIRVRCNIGDAKVWIGGKFKGRTPLDGPVDVPAPAEYEVRVRHKGYIAFAAKFRVPPDATITVNANLVPINTVRGPPVYKRWWFWTTVGGSAALIAAGVVTGILLGRRSKSEPATVTVRW